MNTGITKGIQQRLSAFLIIAGVTIGLAACGNSSSPPPAPPPPPSGPVKIGGVVTDGPVIGGTLFVFAADEVQSALDSVNPNGDRLAALSAATSIGSLTRVPAAEDQYSFDVPEGFANVPVFLLFDNTDAQDDTFKDTPVNLESVVTLGGPGSAQRVNVSMQTTLIAQQVRAALDPDSDGTVIDDAAIETAIEAATANVLNAFTTDTLGRDLYATGFDPITESDDDAVHTASSALGFLVRAASSAEDVPIDEIVAVIAADTSDGDHDGVIPVNLAPTPEMEALAEAVSDIASAGSDEEIAMFAVGPCSSAAVSMARACAVDVFDDLFEGTAICTDILDDADRADCLADATHEPMFGEAFAANFVDPLEIGNTVTENPWFPLLTGNNWVYSGDGETIDVTVTDETKLIDGITCVVVVDVASEEGEVVEITRDWYAQDVIGNVW